MENRAWTSGNSHHRTCSSLVKICFFSLCARGDSSSFVLVVSCFLMRVFFFFFYNMLKQFIYPLHAFWSLMLHESKWKLNTKWTVFSLGTCLGESHTREECSTSTGHVLQAIEKHLQSRKKDQLNNILQGSILIFVVSAWIHGLYTRVAAHPKNTMLEKVQLILLEIWSVHHTKLLT